MNVDVHVFGCESMCTIRTFDLRSLESMALNALLERQLERCRTMRNIVCNTIQYTQVKANPKSNPLVFVFLYYPFFFCLRFSFVFSSSMHFHLFHFHLSHCALTAHFLRLLHTNKGMGVVRITTHNIIFYSQ